MKILHTTAFLNKDSGGPARSVPQLAVAQIKAGNLVGIWCPDSIPEKLADLSVADASDLILLTGSFNEAVQRFSNPDVVHDHGVWRACHQEVASECMSRNLPRIVSPRGMLEPWALKHKRLKKWLAWYLYQRRNLKSAAALHATSDGEAKQLRSLGLFQTIMTVPNGVGGNVLNTVAYGEGHVKNAADTAPKYTATRKALFLSRLHPKKGLPLLIDAWLELRPKDWEMCVVGPAEKGYRQQMENLVDNAGLTSQWHFFDALEGEEKWRAMRDANLFILPSYSENFGIVVAEALSMELPVITTTGTPWAKLIEKACGWWVKPDKHALLDALRDATTSTDQELQAMGARGREWVAEEFSWPTIERRINEGYLKVLENA